MTKPKARQRTIFRVIFTSQGRTYEMYARSVSQGALFGFVVVEDLVFGERSKVVVDPSEEGLKTEFKGVERFSIPMHSVVRIDEVQREGVSRIVSGSKGEGGAVAPFPVPFFGPPKAET